MLLIPTPASGSRRAGDNLFAASIVAVDAKTGEYRWHFQQVHHDIWDYDAPSPVVALNRAVALAESGRHIDCVTIETEMSQAGFPEGRVVLPTAPPSFALEHVVPYIASRIGVGFAFALMALGVWQILGGAVLGGFWFIVIGMFVLGFKQYVDLRTSPRAASGSPSRDSARITPL